MNQALRRLRRLQHPTIWAILAVEVALFFLEGVLELDWAWSYGAVPAKIHQAAANLLEGQFGQETWQTLATLVTPLFLHGGLDHILLNMVFVWVFGSLVSEHLGKWWALGIFFATGVGGNVAEVLMNPESLSPIIGASGAVCGFEGVYLGLALRWRLPWPDVWPLARPIPPLQLAAFAIVGIVADFAMLSQGDQGIAHGAHLGGFITGLAIASAITQFYASESAFQKPRLGNHNQRG